MARITVTGFLIARSLDEADAVSVLLPEHLRLTRDETGCVLFDVFRSTADPCRFAVHEVFVDRAAYEAHQARTRASPWWQSTRDIPREYVLTEGDRSQRMRINLPDPD